MPLAGLSTDQILQTTMHSAAIRAGTIHDGQVHCGVPIVDELPSGMVDPHGQRAVPVSPAELAGYRISRNIRRPRHECEAATARAHHRHRNYPEIHQPTTSRNARADTAVRPYAENVELRIKSCIIEANGAARSVVGC